MLQLQQGRAESVQMLLQVLLQRIKANTCLPVFRKLKFKIFFSLCQTRRPLQQRQQGPLWQPPTSWQLLRQGQQAWVPMPAA